MLSLFLCSGAQGEYTGLRTIDSYLKSIGESQRNVFIQIIIQFNKIYKMLIVFICQKWFNHLV